MASTKLMLFHRRAAGVSNELWRAEWRRQFASTLASLHEAERVVQNVPRRTAGDARLDGIDEVYWTESGAAIEAAASGRLHSGLLMLAPHAAPGWPFGMLARERVQVPRTEGPIAVRRMAMVRKRADIDAASFDHEWDAVHPAFVARLAGIRGYVQSVRVARVPGLPAPDAASTLWWDSVEVCETAYADSGPIGQAHLADMARLFDGSDPTGTYCDAVEMALV